MASKSIILKRVVHDPSGPTREFWRTPAGTLGGNAGTSAASPRNIATIPSVPWLAARSAHQGRRWATWRTLGAGQDQGLPVRELRRIHPVPGSLHELQ